MALGRLASPPDAVPRGRPGRLVLDAGRDLGENPGMGLALVAASRGCRLVRAMPEKTSADKRAALARPQTRRHPRPRISRTSRGAWPEIGRWFLTDPFANPADPRRVARVRGPTRGGSHGRSSLL
jgi:cysteine synthase